VYGLQSDDMANPSYGLFKPLQSGNYIEPMQNMLFGGIAKKQLYGLYDFTCHFYPIRFPLDINKTFYYSDPADKYNYGLTITKKLLKTETTSSIFGDIFVYKFEYLYIDFPDYKSYEWMSEKGVIKRWGISRNTPLMDSTGQIIDTADCYDTCELIGTENINADTLVPLGKR
jgi:hypothetical protein